MPAHCSSKPALSDDVPSWRVNAAHMSAHPYVALWRTGLERKGGISGFPYLQSYANVHNAQEVISCDTTPSDAFTAGLLAAYAFRQHRAVADSAAALCSCCTVQLLQAMGHRLLRGNTLHPRPSTTSACQSSCVYSCACTGGGCLVLPC